MALVFDIMVMNLLLENTNCSRVFWVIILDTHAVLKAIDVITNAGDAFYRVRLSQRYMFIPMSLKVGWVTHQPG